MMGIILLIFEYEYFMENILAKRFRGYYPVIIDIETSGLTAQTDAILEIAAIFPAMDEQGYLYCAAKIHFHVAPFEGANLDPIIVAHTAAFDQGLINKATERCNLKRVPFHPFATFDTASMAGLVLGQTVLAKACAQANIAYDNKEAHSALYDTEVTAELFFYMVNKIKAFGGWPV